MMDQRKKAASLSLFETAFQKKPTVLATAPGRIEVLGNHTDYNEGLTLSAATTYATDMALAPVAGRRCRLISDFAADAMAEFDLSELDTPKKGDWSNYVKGVVQALRARGREIGAFDAAIASDVPLSSGMSSSAALEIAACFAFAKAFAIDFPGDEWAKIGQWSENRYVGVNTGLLDQFSSVFGQKDRLVLCDFRDNRVIRTVPVPSNYVFVVVNTLIAHNLVQSDYNARRESCERAVAALKTRYSNVKALRDMTPATLEAAKDLMAAIDYRRARHIVEENDRVRNALDILDRSDIRAFGESLFASHASSRDNFENSCPELDFLVGLARDIPGCVGARLSGGGFGGISVHLCERSAAETYAERVRAAYRSRTGRDSVPLICGVGAGARVEAVA